MLIDASAGYGFGGPLLPHEIPVLTPEQLAISGPQPRVYTMDLLCSLYRSPSPSPARGKRARDSGEGSASSPAPAASCCIYRDCFHPYKSLRKSSISDRKYLLSSVTFYALATSYSIAAFSLRKFSSLYICATKPFFVVSSGSESDLSSSSPAPIA